MSPSPLPVADRPDPAVTSGILSTCILVYASVSDEAFLLQAGEVVSWDADLGELTADGVVYYAVRPFDVDDLIYSAAEYADLAARRAVR